MLWIDASLLEPVSGCLVHGPPPSGSLGTVQLRRQEAGHLLAQAHLRGDAEALVRQALRVALGVARHPLVPESSQEPHAVSSVISALEIVLKSVEALGDVLRSVKVARGGGVWHGGVRIYFAWFAQGFSTTRASTSALLHTSNHPDRYI